MEEINKKTKEEIGDRKKQSYAKTLRKEFRKLKKMKRNFYKKLLNNNMSPSPKSKFSISNFNFLAPDNSILPHPNPLCLAVKQALHSRNSQTGLHTVSIIIYRAI